MSQRAPDLAPPEKFTAPNGKQYTLNLFNGVIYLSTAQLCGGTVHAFLSFDLKLPENQHSRAGRRRSVGTARCGRRS